MKVFYETTVLDGVAAAAVVRQGFPGSEIVPVQDSMKFDWGQNLMDRKLVVLGLSHVAKTIARMYPHLCFVWIGMHDEVSQQLTDHDIEGLRAPHFGICELAWQFVNKLPAARSPRAVRLIGRYAVGDLEYDADVEPFHWGMMAVKDLTPMHPVWNTLLLGDDREEVACRVMAGRSIREYVAAEEARREAVVA